MKQAPKQATFRSFKLRTTQAVLPIAGLMLLAGGCDQRTEAGKAVEQSSRQLEVLNAAGSTPAPEAIRQKSYTDVVATAGGTKSGTDGEQAAAKMILASAQRGLSDGPATLAIEAEGKLRTMINLTQVSLANWSSANASADAAASFDISKQLADIAASKAEREKEIATDTKRKGELQKRIADLRSLAKAKLEQADAKQDQYVKQMATTGQMSAVQATPIVEAANVVRREGDKLRLEGLKISAEADQIEPVLAEATAQVAKATKQRADLDEIEKSLSERLAASKKEAADMRALAQNAASEIDKGVAEIEALRSGELASQYGKSMDAIKKGLVAAKDAQKDGGPSAKLSVALAQVDMAEASWGKAQSVAAFASLLDSLAHANHPLPNASAYATKLEGVQKEFAELTTQAGEAFGAAQTAIQGVRVQDKGATERLEKLKGLLENAGKYLKGEEKDLAAAFQLQSRATKPAAIAEATPGAPGDEAGAVRGVLQAFNAAQKSGNAAASLALFDLDSPAAAASPSTAFVRASIKLDAACFAKFKKSFGQIAAASLPTGTPGAETGIDVAKADIQVAGDIARVTGPGVPGVLKLNRTNGRWLIDPTSLTSALPPMPGLQDKIPLLTKATDAFADDVLAGKYPDEATLGQAYVGQIMKVMGMAGPGGG
ncbi:MAG: hypothetical protein WC718_00750 [Phycisphaerales bacterium]|jgi:hypothetical protein